MHRYLLGTITLLLGVAALALTIIPAAVYDEPGPVERKASAAENNKPGGVTFSTSRFTIRLGKPQEPAPPPATVPTVDPPAPRAKPFKLAGMGCSLAGFAAGPFAWMRRRQRPLVGGGLMLCWAALVWQYVLIGVAAGVGLAVLLIILSHFG
jgi:hypothetical protein